MTITTEGDNAIIKCFDDTQLVIPYGKWSYIKGADNVTVSVQHCYTGGNIISGIQVNLTYINIYDCRIDGNLQITWM